MTNAPATFKTNVSKDLKPRKQKSINTKATIINRSLYIDKTLKNKQNQNPHVL